MESRRSIKCRDRSLKGCAIERSFALTRALIILSSLSLFSALCERVPIKHQEPRAFGFLLSCAIKIGEREGRPTIFDAEGGRFEEGEDVGAIQIRRPSVRFERVFDLTVTRGNPRKFEVSSRDGRRKFERAREGLASFGITRSRRERKSPTKMRQGRIGIELKRRIEAFDRITKPPLLEVELGERDERLGPFGARLIGAFQRVSRSEPRRKSTEREQKLGVELPFSAHLAQDFSRFGFSPRRFVKEAKPNRRARIVWGKPRRFAILGLGLFELHPLPHRLSAGQSDVEAFGRFANKRIELFKRAGRSLKREKAFGDAEPRFDGARVDPLELRAGATGILQITPGKDDPRFGEEKRERTRSASEGPAHDRLGFAKFGGADESLNVGDLEVQIVWRIERRACERLALGQGSGLRDRQGAKE